MDEKEDKGFVVKDRRKVSLDDLDREPTGGSIDQEPNTGEEASAAGIESEKGREQEREHTLLPEVTLATFVFSLSSSALVHLGEIPDPQDNEVHVDLNLAKQIIDTLGMLQDKTRGNLDPDEDKLLRTMLYDLRMRYVQKSKG